MYPMIMTRNYCTAPYLSTILLLLLIIILPIIIIIIIYFTLSCMRVMSDMYVGITARDFSNRVIYNELFNYNKGAVDITMHCTCCVQPKHGRWKSLLMPCYVIVFQVFVSPFYYVMFYLDSKYIGAYFLYIVASFHVQTIPNVLFLMIPKITLCDLKKIIIIMAWYIEIIIYLPTLIPNISTK